MDVSDVSQESAPAMNHSQNRVRLTETAKMSVRFGVSLGATAAIATAVLIDYNVVNKQNTSLVVDKNKVARERNKLVSISNSEPIPSIKGLYFDGRRDLTLQQEKI